MNLTDSLPMNLMNPFDDRFLSQPQYSELKTLKMGEASYVSVEQLLDILRHRAILSLRIGIAAEESIHATNFQNGRFEEMRTLYEALDNK